MELNTKDDQLIALLRENARMSVSEMARRLSSSRTAVQMRLKKLERNGTIDGYGVRLSANHRHSRLRAIVMIKFAPINRDRIEAELCAIQQLTSLYSISGEFDMAGVISAGTIGELDVLIDGIGCLDGIEETKSSIILSTKLDR